MALIPESILSFTYPDSYVSRLLAIEKSPHFNSKFHGQVFTLTEMSELQRDPDVSNEAWKNEERKFDFFIEAQIWDERFLGDLPRNRIIYPRR